MSKTLGTVQSSVAESVFFADIRLSLRELAIKDLLGPSAGPDEELGEKESARPSDRYVVGMLAPKKVRVRLEEDEELAESGVESPEEQGTDPNTLPAESTFPSSIGLTFSVTSDTKQLRVSTKWGRYFKTDSEKWTNPENGKPKRVWKRIHVERSVEIDLTAETIDPIAPAAEQPEITIRGIVRQRDGANVVSLFLVNGYEQEKTAINKDEQWIFQVELEVEAIDGSPVFIRRVIEANGDDPEATEMAMLYRKDIEFAVGHGVATHADVPPNNPWRATRLSTRVIPAYEVQQQTPPIPTDPGFDKLADLTLDMKALASTADSDFEHKLSPLVEAYDAWISRERQRIDDPSQHLEPHREAAQRTLARCTGALDRIRVGIALLGKNTNPAEAFRFANRAMHLQRLHTIFAEGRRRGEKPELAVIDADPKNHSWRPFQLAFLLLNLPSTTDIHHPDRSDETDAIADLLWFPTGGGKTEAYLGVAAYVMALRRLQGVIETYSGEHGIAVLMRYTLRLLTLQQFQRAAALMCGCELIRREDPAKWGDARFRIGLWVGMRATPNTFEQAEESLQRGRGNYRRGSIGAVGTPAQIPNCPWCGERISAGKDIVADRGRRRIITYCGDTLGNCQFTARLSPGEGLPVLVTDEEIYRLLPSLLVATVDKFAQLPWNGSTEMLFGRVSKFCPRHGFRSPEMDERMDEKDSHPKRDSLPAVKSIDHPPLRPPDLIIQDELHLISGPLGSLVGLYETVIDELCSWTIGGKRIRPKVIASTATIRNAEEQVRALFLRRVEVFPPPGLDIDDNFFSIRRPPGPEYPGRLYIGICATGKRLKAVLIRVYVALLGAAQKLYEEHGAPADPWMTLAGYFNSLRELGGMRRLVEDDIRTRLRGIAIRGLGNRRMRVLEELTSRKSSAEIPDVLDLLEAGFDPDDDRKREEARKKGLRYPKPVPIDVLLATNMVSVGVDIKRLGLMVVAGQPKTTAEYIQATSRIGRFFPGLVCTVYNWARPRDLSHFERFEHYHATFYERVEALSVTPFASRAIDRGLSALLVSIVRDSGIDFNDNHGASRVTVDHPTVKHALDVISKRAARVLADNGKEAEIRQRLMELLETWLARSVNAGAGRLGYEPVRDGVTVPLLRRAEEDPWDTFTCLNSLRDVEPQSAVILVDDGIRGVAEGGGPAID